MSFIGADCGFAEADAVLFGAPYDSTTSFRPGTRFGPAAVRAESFGIETYSPYQDRDLGDVRVHDAGDLELPFGAPDRALDMIEEKAAGILAAGKTPFLLGIIPDVISGLRTGRNVIQGVDQEDAVEFRSLGAVHGAETDSFAE